ncbi:MAG: AhpC/TSA family protein [Planctomycetota bacterium]
MRQRSESGPFPPVLIVHSGTPEEAEQFFATRWPEARAVSDPDRALFEAFDLRHGSPRQLLGLRSFMAAFKAMRHGVGRPAGDPWLLSGWFLLHADGRLAWSQPHDFAGEEPRIDELLEFA